MKNILKEIGIILRTHGKEPNPLFLKKLYQPVHLPYSPFIMVIQYITNPYDIVNTFDNYFPSIAETTKKV